MMLHVLSHRRAQHVSNGGNCVSTLWPFNSSKKEKKLVGSLIRLGAWLFVTTRRNTLSQRAESKPTITPTIHLKPQDWYYGRRYLSFWSQKWTRGGETGENILIGSD